MKTIFFIVSLVLTAASLVIVVLPDTIQAGTFTAFGPQDYFRSTKKPVRIMDDFSVLNPDTSYTLTIYNGGKDNQFQDEVTSAIIKLNGDEITDPNEFNQKFSYIEKPIHLSNDNELTVEIRSKPGSGITAEIIGVDNDPPTITAILTPPPNAEGWNSTDVTVSFQCSDMTSGIESCSDPVIVETEGAVQIVTGYATDMAGNTAMTSVTINLDKTPPNIAITKPADGAILQDSPFNVKGSASDDLSGIATVTCSGAPVSLANSTFSIDLPLVEGENLIEAEAIDLAGNTEIAGITVTYAPPELELTYVDQFEMVWWDLGRFGTFHGAYWRPIAPDGFHALGHYGEGDYSNPPQGFMFAARELTPGALAHPVDYVKVWDVRGSGAFFGGSFWRPVPPAGYVCLGLVGQRGRSKPGTDEIMCVRQDLVVPGKVGNTIWIDEKTRADVDFGSWQIIPEDENGIYSGTFTGNNFHSSPPADPVFCLAAWSVRRHELDSEDIEWLVQTQGPVLWLHPSEEYFLDDPEYVLDNMGLVWGLVQNEKEFDSFSFQPHGILDTSAAGLMEDVQYIEDSDPNFTDPNFTTYLNIGDSLRVGDLTRAKALVRLRPWNSLFTDVQFWFFYPFNGPGRVEICLSGLWCDNYQLVTNGRHYGDWEHITLRFSNIEKELVSLYMSRHDGGQWLTRAQFGAIQFIDKHPVIYSALYSHAHYPQAARYDYERLKSVDYGIGTFSIDLWDVTGPGYLYEAFDPDKYWIFSSQLPYYPVSEPEWLNFAGHWGQYERLATTFDYTVYEYTYKEVQGGPFGPAMKTSWQRGDSSEYWWWTPNLEGHEACFDDIDNDGDGEIDCNDQDCWSDPTCIHINR